MLLSNAPRLTLDDVAAIEKAIAFTTEKYQEDVTADKLSLEFGIPAKKIQPGFKRKTGLTVYAYLQQLRLEHAKAFLKDTSLPIKIIARKTGFRTPSHFGEFFKKFTGLTPDQYRFGKEE